MRLIATLFCLLLFTSSFGQTKFQKDFAYYWKTINDNFAYFNKQKTNWAQVQKIYQARVDTISRQAYFIHLLEETNNELYNGHVFLNANTPSSNRTIPTGTDLKAVFHNQQFVITEVREGFNADLCGLQPGMIVTHFNGVPVNKAISRFLPKSAAGYDKPMYDFAINMLLAGTHNIKRVIAVKYRGTEQVFYPDSILNKTESNYSTLLQVRQLPSNVGYIKINNSLGNSDLIKAFDEALDGLMNTKGLILDLRETPSGGNTTVARAILGRFISHEQPYQKHIYVAEENRTGIKRSTLELVSPRLAVYDKPLVVLVNYWTGSMGEGMAIAFDGMKRAKVAGTPMAGLLGEIYTFETPELKLPFSFPCVQLQHINGQPREDYKPAYPIANQKQAVEVAMGLLNK